MKIVYQGEEIEVERVNVEEQNDPWAEYKLEDGVTLRIKSVLGIVYKAKTKKTDDGLPLYITRSQNVVIAYPSTVPLQERPA